jgi:hypothetical protein
LVDASDEFFEFLEYWKERGVKKFILFVAPDASDTKIQEEYLRQRERFRVVGIEYELWGEGTLANKLRPEPGITRTYLDEHWRDVLCGTSIAPFPQESVTVNSILATQLETFAGQVADAADREVDALRAAWRSGRRADAKAGIERLRRGDRWQAFPVQLRAKIIRFEAQLALEEDDLQRAQVLSDEAGRLDPDANHRLVALIARAQGSVKEAL